MTEALTDTGIAPLGRIVRAKEAGLYCDAESALLAARAAAEEIRTAAALQIELSRTEAMAEADHEARQETARIVAETAAAAQRTLAALPLQIAEAIAEGVAKVIGGIDLAEAVARAAQRALAELVEQHAVVVHVNPTAQGGTRARLAAWGSGARVVGDAALAPDACVIETPAGFVRAGLAEQVATLRAALVAGAAGDG
jgi:type III secretion protein L